MRPLSRRRRFSYAAVSLLSSVALSLVVLEAAARWLERRSAAAHARPGPPLALMRANPAGTGSYRLRPNLDTVAVVKGLSIPVRTNSHGLRGPELTAAKPPGIQRVAFFGDSFTFGCWADRYENTFVGAFARQMDPRRFETLNFGVGGYGLADIELQLQEQALAFAPDYVLVMLFTGNDLRDTYLGVHKYRLVGGTVEFDEDVLAAKLPDYRRESEPFALRPARDPSALRRGLARLATFRLLLSGLSLDNPWLEFRPSRYFTSFSYWSQYPFPPLARHARDTTLEVLGRLKTLARRHGARLAVVTIPSREQVYAARASGRFFDITLPQAYVRLFARERRIPFLDLLDKLRPHVLSTGQQLYVAGDIHFNTRGHLLVAGFVREWFLAEVLRRSPAGR